MPGPRVELSGPQKQHGGLTVLLRCLSESSSVSMRLFYIFAPPLWSFGIILKVICACRRHEAGQRGTFLWNVWVRENRVVLQENIHLGVMHSFFVFCFSNNWPQLPGILGSLYIIFFIQWMGTGPKATMGGGWYFWSECCDRSQRH